MYCPNCACVSNPIGPAPVVRPERPGDQAYCGKCGTKAIGGNLFCTSCGNLLYGDDVPGPPTLLRHSDADTRETESTPILPTAIHSNFEAVQIQETMAAVDVLVPLGGTLTDLASSSAISSPDAVATNGIETPVVRFVLLALGTMLMVSVIAFAVSDDIARSALSVWLPLLVAVFILPFLLYLAIKTFGTLKYLSVADGGWPSANSTTEAEHHLRCAVHDHLFWSWVRHRGQR